MKPIPEINRLAYGGIGILVGIAVNRIAGLHIVLHHIAVDGLTSTDTAWFAAFVVGLLVGTLTPMWFWLVRPTLASRVRAVDPNYSADE